MHGLGFSETNDLGPIYLPNRLTGPAYLKFPQNEIQDIVVFRFSHMVGHLHYSRDVRTYLNEFGNN